MLDCFSIIEKEDTLAARLLAIDARLLAKLKQLGNKNMSICITIIICHRDVSDWYTPMLQVTYIL